MLHTIRWILGNRLTFGAAGEDGRIAVEMRGVSVRALAGEIAGFGAAIVVESPPEVRVELGRIARELAAQYPDARGYGAHPWGTR